MTDHDALLAAVIANPDDDTPRLVMADWFQENGDEDRAEFIRVQCEIDSYDAAKLAGKRIKGLTARKRKSLGARQLRLLGPLVGSAGAKWRKNYCEWFVEPYPYTNPLTLSLRRGFVESVICTAEDWLAHAVALHWHPSQNRPCPPTAQPIRKVTLTTWPVLSILAELEAELGRLRDSGVEFKMPPDHGIRVEVTSDDLLHDRVLDLGVWREFGRRVAESRDRVFLDALRAAD